MVPLPSLSNAAVERPIPLRFRPDLTHDRQRNRGVEAWLVHDPVALRTYQFGAHERFVWESLDGRTSLAELKRRFEAEFPPGRLEITHLQAFLQMLHREGLVVADAAGQGAQLLARHDTLRSRQRWSRAANLLAIRFPGCNPSAALRAIEPWTRGLYQPVTMAASVALILVAVALLAGAAVRGELPNLAELLNWRTGLYLLAGIGLAKVLHELAHALTCAHFGGECHEMGFMMLVFSPCLYCDVSSSIRFGNKWQRMAVSAAGMFVELLVAAAAAMVWYVSQPGALRDFCFVLAAACSINTLLINGNPLLRFDGYYLLADWLEIPNLQSAASQSLRRRVGGWFVAGRAAPLPEARSVPEPLLLGYGLLSLVYRILILISIVWAGYALLGTYGAIPLAHLLAFSVLVSALLRPQMTLFQLLRDPARRGQLRRRRVAGSIVLAALLGSALLAIPWPQRLWLSAVVQPREASRVYVNIPGILEDSVEVGVRVQEGQPLATLKNLELDLQIAQLQSQVGEQQQHVEELRRLQGREAGLAEQLPTATTALEESQQRIERRLADRERLILRAPQGGIVLPAQQAMFRPEQDELDRVQGLPTDRHNLGRYLEVGTLFCEVGDLEQQQALASVSASDVDLIRPGQRVELRFRQWPGERLRGRVDQISAVDVPRAPALTTEALEPSGARPALGPSSPTPMYQVRISLQQDHPRLRLGTQGMARITVRSESFGKRIWRQLRSHFFLGF